MSLKLKIATNTLAQLVSKGVSALSSFIVVVLLARQFGPQGFGEFTKAVSYVTIFYFAVDFGLNAVVLKYLEETKDKAYLANLMALRLLLSFFWIFIGLSILSLLPFNQIKSIGFTPIAKLGIIAMMPTVINRAIFITVNVWFQQQLRYDLAVIANVFGALALVILTFIFINFGFPLPLVISSYSVGTLIMAATAVKISGAKKFINKWSVFKMKNILYTSLPLGLTLFFNVLTTRMSIIALTLFRDTSEVGLYGLAYRFFELVLTVPSFFMNTVYPLMLRRKQTGLSELAFFSKKTFSWLVVMSLGVMLAGFVLSPLIIKVHVEFRNSIPIFRFFLVFLPVFFLTSLAMWLLITLGQNKSLALIYGSVMLVNLILNWILVPPFGYFAAAAITVFSEFLILMASGYLCLKALKVTK